METLSDEQWDVVISGTSLPQSLLALALSKSDLKVLHVDKNNYYGGADAGLSLNEAQAWLEAHKASGRSDNYDISTLTEGLSPSRAYTISLRPQIIYARSRFLPTLVFSQIHSQLEFQAVGAYWTLSEDGLKKIPTNREDVFADDSLSVRDKRRLMGLLRHVLDENNEEMPTPSDISLKTVLEEQFKIPEEPQVAVQALALLGDKLANVDTSFAISRLRRHLHSTGYFGPGLAAVIAKYGSNSEIAQVACRAGAVGGFVYLLGQGLTSVQSSSPEQKALQVKLTDGTEVRSRFVVGMRGDLPADLNGLSTSDESAHTQRVSHRISIVSSPLRSFFVAPSDSGPVPAVSIVLVKTGEADAAPIYLQIHSEDTGECPAGQCIIYASTARDPSNAQSSLQRAIDLALHTNSSDGEKPKILWSMTYSVTEPLATAPASDALQHEASGRILLLPNRRHDIAFDDTILDSVKAAWEAILGPQSTEYDFLRFAERVDPDAEG